ncbi:MAG: hypothetical protein E7177_07225 [Erysipelotrichaceae bacterium]|nr:hypothetical protein [Erysipelotrichaceae bacterium]
MNKYQLEFFNQLHIKPKETENKLEKYVLEGEVMTIKQNRNYNINKYDFIIEGVAVNSIVKVEGLNGRTWKEIDKTHFSLDFNNKFSKIKIHFLNDIVEPIVITLIMEDADKEAYDLELERIKKENKKKEVNLEVASGYNLINVYFSSVSGMRYSYSIINLYRNGRRIGRYTVDGMGFLAIPNLASGDYQVSIEQYDFDRKLIYSSEECKKVSVNQSPQPVVRH